MKDNLLRPSRKEFRELAKEGNLIPVCTELIADSETPVSALHKLRDAGYTFLLESAENSDAGGRYSFVGCCPRVLFESNGHDIRITDEDGVCEYKAEGDPLTELQKLMSRFKPVAARAEQGEGAQVVSRFSGGAVGYIGYDVVRYFEPSIGEPPRDDLQLPEMLFMVTNGLLIFDHRLRRLRILANAFVDEAGVDAAYDAARAEIAKLLKQLREPSQLPGLHSADVGTPVTVTSNTTQSEFEKMVTECQEYIRAGDVFQIVVSQRFETEYAASPLSLYRALRFVNPSPYMFCLKFGEAFALVGSSPEVHVRALDGKVEIRPIAGTRRRGSSEAEDAANEADLLADPKERAEHLMLVDLARNDVGRIAEFGSVRVTDFMTVERYSHVMHIVSNVVGDLRPESNAYDVMRATFPAGTVSGSPKVRAMQIINGTEKSKRGSYSGAVAYFGFDGHLDSCIALRTVVLKQGRAYVQAGAGVVADSTPEGEFQETVNKAMGVMRAIERANAAEGADL